MTRKLLTAGHIVKDVSPDGWRPGGGVLYAAAQALKLGAEVAVFTACADDIEPEAILPAAEWLVQPSTATTTFENRYEDGQREQRLLARGAQLNLDSLPDKWRRPPMALLTPLFHEIEPEDVARFNRAGTLLGVAAQGWLRSLEGDRVMHPDFEPEPAWLQGEVVFISEEDVSQPEMAGVWQRRAPVVALTRGPRGCTVWDRTGRHDVSAPLVDEVHPTGAGDVFAAAFLLVYEETSDALEAARFAVAAGALSVRGDALETVASREEIEAVLRQGEVKVA
jgi:1D-myo-inositol 3-kinase